MSNGFSPRKFFAAAAAAVTLSLSPAFADAATPHKTPHAQKHHVKKAVKKTAAVKSAKTTPVKPAPIKRAVKKKFVPHSPTGESCPSEDAAAQRIWLHPSFDIPPAQQQTLLSEAGFPIGRKMPDGIFTERTVQSVNEFRILTGQSSFRESFTAHDMRDLRDFSAEAERAMTRYNLPPAEATTLVMAVRHSSLDEKAVYKTFFSGEKSAPVAAETWIALVSLHGREFGLAPYVRAIETAKQGELLSVTVHDPALLQQILAMRDHPRLSVLLMAAQSGDLPPAVYKSMLPPQRNLSEQQKNLRTLGFDLGDESTRKIQGPLTEAALQKFGMLYAPAYATFGPLLTETGHAQEAYLGLFAELAQKDAADHGISTAAAAAIRLAALRTGADFGYMMELSSAESNFDQDAKAATSSATGLYQFTEDTWLHMIRRYGEKYGLGALVPLIEAKEDMYGTLVARVENPYARMMMLELRKDPHLAALMSAEFQMRNKWLVECSVNHEINRTEQYLGHFLGRRGAAHFLTRMAQNPNATGARMFPDAAAANKPIFYAKNAKGKLVPRSLREIYKVLDRKFDKGTFEDKGIPEELSTDKIATAKVPPAPPQPPL